MRLTSLVRIGLAAGVVAFILWRVPVIDLWATFGQMQTNWLWPALASTLGMLAVRTLRWHRLLLAGKVSLPRSKSARSLFGGFALSVVGPGRLGEFGRCLFVEESSRASVFLLNFFDRALDSWALGTYGVVTLLAVAPRPFGVFALAVWLAIQPLVMGLPSLLTHLGRLPWWHETFRAELRAAGQKLADIRTMRYAAWALVSGAFDGLTFYFLLRAFHAVTFKAAAITFPWIVIAGGLPVSLGGVGPREGAAGLLLARFAVPQAAATDAALLLYAFSGLLPAILGGLWLLARPPQGGLRGLRAIVAWAGDGQSNPDRRPSCAREWSTSLETPHPVPPCGTALSSQAKWERVRS